jgi:Ca2+:H+ antiporter
LSSLLILAVIALLIPALFDYTEREVTGAAHASVLDERLSLGVAVVLILVYAANLVYSLVTHRDVFAAQDENAEGLRPRRDAEDTEDAEITERIEITEARMPDARKADGHALWPLWKVLAVMVGATAITALEAELVSAALEETSAALGVTTFFLGITVLAVVGNAAEYVSAVYFARQDRMDLVMGITVGSTIQIALLVAPILVLVSYFMGKPMNLVFANPIELIAIAGVAFAVNTIAHDGETTWFEGVLLLAVYVLLGMAFFFITPPA